MKKILHTGVFQGLEQESPAGSGDGLVMVSLVIARRRPTGGTAPLVVAVSKFRASHPSPQRGEGRVPDLRSSQPCPALFTLRCPRRAQRSAAAARAARGTSASTSSVCCPTRGGGCVSAPRMRTGGTGSRAPGPPPRGVVEHRDGAARLRADLVEHPAVSSTGRRGTRLAEHSQRLVLVRAPVYTQRAIAFRASRCSHRSTHSRSGVGRAGPTRSVHACPHFGTHPGDWCRSFTSGAVTADAGRAHVGVAGKA